MLQICSFYAILDNKEKWIGNEFIGAEIIEVASSFALAQKRAPYSRRLYVMLYPFSKFCSLTTYPSFIILSSKYCRWLFSYHCHFGIRFYVTVRTPPSLAREVAL